MWGVATESEVLFTHFLLQKFTPTENLILMGFNFPILQFVSRNSTVLHTFIAIVPLLLSSLTWRWIKLRGRPYMTSAKFSGLLSPLVRIWD